MARMETKTFPVLLLFIISVSQVSSGQTKYPEKSGDRMQTINRLFRCNLLEISSNSLDHILQLVNVSTALSEIQTEFTSYKGEYEDLIVSIIT